MTTSELDVARAKRVLFVGEGICDVYHYGLLLQRPLKEAIICAEWTRTEVFDGGVIAAAKHAMAFCANVTIWSDREVRKERFVEQAHNRKLFEVYYGPQRTHGVSQSAPLDDYDAVIVMDYGHGMLEDAMIERLCGEARFLAVNVQSNAGNYGYNLATKYRRVDYLCVDEPEARLATQNQHGPIDESLEWLAMNAASIAITRGHLGAIGWSQGNRYESRAHTGVPLDTMGAGDAFFAVSALYAEDLPFGEVLKIGNAAGYAKCKILGHRESVTRAAVEEGLRAWT